MRQIPEELLTEIVERLAKGLQPERIILFGSHAYGEPTDSSDIDILVVLSDSTELRHQRAQRAYACLRGLTAPTEIIVLTRKEVERKASVPCSLVSQALRHGRVLYG